MKKLFFFGTLQVAMIFSVISSAQDFSNKGKDFWIGYGHHVRMFNPGPAEQMQLYITSDVSTTGNVSIQSIGFNQAFSVIANQITTINIPRTAALMDHGLYNHGIRVTAVKPVVVYGFIYVNAISGATVVLPTNTLGSEYYSVNYTQVSNENNCHSYFFVIAVDTGTTTVEITPSAVTKAGQPANVPFRVTLTQGQIYQVLGQSTGMSGVDLTGSKIKSINTGTGCKKIAVFSGSSKISIGCVSPGTSDNLYQQMYPTVTWGRKYITVPGVTNSNNFFRIVKSDPSAVVTRNGIVIPAASFTNNFYFQFSDNQPNVIESDKPILVAQYFTTQGCSGNPGGAPPASSGSDPEMIFLNSIEQTINNVTLNSMQPATGTNITVHYLNVVLKNNAAALSTFQIDGVGYGGSFLPVPADNNFAYARIPVSQGTHNVSCDTGFNIIAYGFGNAESYGYSGGTNLRDLYQFISIKNQYATVDFPAACKGSPFNFYMAFPYQPLQITWKFNGLFADTTISNPVSDSSWVVSGRTLFRYKLDKLYTIMALGTYPIKVVANNPTPDGCSGEQEIDYDLQVFDPPVADFNFITTGCVTDQVSFSDQTNGNGRPAYRWFWNFGEGAGYQEGVKNPNYTFSTPGTKTVSLKAVTDIGCITEPWSSNIVVTNKPSAAFEIASKQCVNNAITFKDLSVTNGTTPNSGLAKWTWDFGGGDVRNITVSNYSPAEIKTYISTGPKTVTLQVENEAGCKSNLLTKPVIINPLPVSGFIMPDVCLIDPFAEFTDTSRIADGSEASFTYLWNFGDPNATPANPNSSALQNPRHRYSAIGVYNVSLTITSNNACVVTKTQAFTVNGSVPKSIFAVQNPAGLCSNQDVSLVNNSTVDFGRIVKVEIYWDYANDPTIKTIDNNPSPGKTYSYLYPDFGTPATKTYTLQMVSYSGINCVSSSSQTITVKASPKIQFNTMNPVCEEVPQFQITQASEIYGLTGTGIFTGPGLSTNGIFNPKTAGPGLHTIRYTFNAANGCTASDSATIRVHPTPFVNAGPDKTVLEGGFTTLSGSGSGNGIRYIWSPAIALDTLTKFSPKASPTDDITYRLTVTSADGCVAFDDVFVKVLKAPTIPNVFSPNGDGKNDRWEIQYLESYPGATVEVYNRYGQMLFRTVGYNKPWDGTFNGKPVPAGTYYYIIDPKSGRQQIAGFVDVVR